MSKAFSLVEEFRKISLYLESEYEFTGAKRYQTWSEWVSTLVDSEQENLRAVTLEDAETSIFSSKSSISKVSLQTNVTKDFILPPINNNTFSGVVLVWINECRFSIMDAHDKYMVAWREREHRVVGRIPTASAQYLISVDSILDTFKKEAEIFKAEQVQGTSRLTIELNAGIMALKSEINRAATTIFGQLGKYFLDRLNMTWRGHIMRFMKNREALLSKRGIAKVMTNRSEMELLLNMTRDKCLFDLTGLSMDFISRILYTSTQIAGLIGYENTPTSLDLAHFPIQVQKTFELIGLLTLAPELAHSLSWFLKVFANRFHELEGVLDDLVTNELSLEDSL